MDEVLFQERMRRAIGRTKNASGMSKATGISTRSISSYANGKADPSRERLVAIAKAAKVSIAWLAAGEGPMEIGKIGLSGPPPPIDEDTLRASVEALEEVLSVTGREMMPSDKGHLIYKIYNLFTDEEQVGRKDTVIKILQMVA